MNTGSGYNIIVNNKKDIDVNRINTKLNKWLKEDYYKIKKEPQYKNIEKKILIEKYLNDKNDELNDFKFYCFNGKVECIEVDFDRFSEHTMNFYDVNWKLLDLKKGSYLNYSKEFKKPANLKKMITLAECISSEFPFARNDFYNIDGKVIFGEITLTPAGGLTPFKPLDKDIEFANKIDLNKYKCKRILFVGSVGGHGASERLDGETIKNRNFVNYLELQDGISVFTVDSHNYRKKALSIIFNIFKYYKSCDHIIISASQTGASIFIRFLKFIKSKKTIDYFLIGGSQDKHIENGKQKVKYYSNVRNIYVESDILKNNLNKLGLNNVLVMHNFRKIQKFDIKYRSSNKIKFVFFGRVIKVKGIEQAISLIKRLTDEKMNVSLDIYGQCEMSYLEYLNNLIGDYNNIIYKGSIKPDGKTEYEILSCYDIFILPTEHVGEGLPGALIDSYIAGLAVLVSDWKYAREYVVDNENGFIFDYKNYEDMYNKAKKMILDNKISKFKSKSLDLSHEYLIDDVLKGYIKKLVNNGDIDE